MLTALKNTFTLCDFGRLRRRDYLPSLIAFMGITYLVSWLFISYFSHPIFVFFFFVYFIAGVTTIHVRRIHDLGKPGWYILLFFVPILGVLFGLLLILRSGNIGDNEFGGDPKDRKSLTVT